MLTERFTEGKPGVFLRQTDVPNGIHLNADESPTYLRRLPQVCFDETSLGIERWGEASRFVVIHLAHALESTNTPPDVLANPLPKDQLQQLPVRPPDHYEGDAPIFSNPDVRVERLTRARIRAWGTISDAAARLLNAMKDPRYDPRLVRYSLDTAAGILHSKNITLLVEEHRREHAETLGERQQLTSAEQSVQNLINKNLRERIVDVSGPDYRYLLFPPTGYQQ